MAGAGTGITPWAQLTVPPPTFSGEADELIDAERLGSNGGANDVDDSVGGSDFVKVNVLDVDVVDLGFSRAQREKDFAGDCFTRSLSGAASMMRRISLRWRP